MKEALTKRFPRVNDLRQKEIDGDLLAFVPYSMPFSCMTFCVCVLAEIIRVAKHIKNSYVAFPKPRRAETTKNSERSVVILVASET